jgi:cytochrome c oxidase cbb3-type subunit II
MSITATLWRKHWILERNSILLLLGILIVIAIGGLVEVVPLFYLKSTIETAPGMRPYTPLELAGRNIYVREGCYLCHSQMIRALRDEVERYGHYSLAAESQYDRPFQGLQAQRTGPGAGRRQVFRRLAARPSEGSAFGGPRLDHAGLPLAVHQRT